MTETIEVTGLAIESVGACWFEFVVLVQICSFRFVVQIP